MQSDVLSTLLFQGRERRALLKAKNAMQNRLRAHLHGLYASYTAEGGLGIADSLTRSSPSADDNGQDGDLSSSENLTRVVPSWLKKAPKWSGLKDKQWQAIVPILFDRSVTANILLGYAESLKTNIKPRSKAIEQTAKSLPVYQWTEAIPGVGALGLGNIICETGDLSNYPSYHHVWKRLGVAVIDGERQRRRKGVSQEEALAIGYVPERRAMLWQIAENLVMQNKLPDKTPLFYRQLYLDRKVREEEKAPELKKFIWDLRAKRYMSKIFIKHLWRAWRDHAFT